MNMALRWPARGLPTGLQWALWASVLLSVWAWFHPAETPPAVVDPAQPLSGTALSTPATVRPAPAKVGSYHASRPAFDATDFDPFAGPSAGPVRPAAQPSPVPLVAAPPPAPAPPAARQALEARFAGRLVNPEGRQIVYLLLRDQTVAAAVGSVLPGGFVVESIEPTGIYLRPEGDATGEVMTIPLPRGGGEGR